MDRSFQKMGAVIRRAELAEVPTSTSSATTTLPRERSTSTRRDRTTEPQPGVPIHNLVTKVSDEVEHQEGAEDQAPAPAAATTKT